MIKKTVTITDVANLRDGDTATFEIDGHEYTGPVHKDDDGDLMFATRVARWADGSPALIAGGFVSATREIEVPKPLSIRTDVVIAGGRWFPLAVPLNSHWVCFSEDGYMYQFEAWEIESSKLAKVVEA